MLLTIGAAAAYLFTVSSSTVATLKTTYAKVGNTSNATKILKATKPLTLVLMGVDTGGVGRGTSDSWDGNSDSQIVITLNPETDTTTMVSMERDTMSNILDSDGNKVGNPQKMNAAYPLGYNAGDLSGKGLETAASYSMKTIGAQAGVPIDNFVVVNFDGLINLVNAVGGVDVYNDPKNISNTKEYPNPNHEIFISDTEPQYTAVIKAGKQHLNGEQALVYARDRHHRANGDYGRIAAQREVIAALMKKMLALDNVTQYQKFLSEVSKDFKTNIPISTSTLTSLLGYKDCFKKIVSIQYQAVDGSVNGGSYQFMTNNIYLAVQNNLRKSLGETTSDTVSDNLITYENYYGGTEPSYYMPSATVTENGKSTVYGIDKDGSLVKINSSNSGVYVSTLGEGITSASSGSSASSSSSSEDSSDSSESSDGSYSSDSESSDSSSLSTTTDSDSTDSDLPSGLTQTTTAGVYTDPSGYYVYYKNGQYVYSSGNVYSAQ